MTEQGRASGGEFESKVSNEDVIAVLEEAETPVLSTTLVSEELPVTRQAVYYRLQGLCENGRVGRMKVGARAIVWWVADESE